LTIEFPTYKNPTYYKKVGLFQGKKSAQPNFYKKIEPVQSGIRQNSALYSVVYANSSLFGSVNAIFISYGGLWAGAVKPVFFVVQIRFF
jgi:hypothetical protein